MHSLSKAQILAAADTPPPTPVDVPEWGGTVYVRVMSGVERDAFEASVITDGQVDLANARAKLVVRVLCDEHGNRLLDDADLDALGRRSAIALNRVYAVAQRINRLTPDDIEDLVKNSASVRGAASS